MLFFLQSSKAAAGNHAEGKCAKGKGAEGKTCKGKTCKVKTSPVQLPPEHRGTVAGHPWVGGRLGAVGVSLRLRSKWRLQRHTAGWELGARPANKALLLCLLPAAPRPASLPWIVHAFSLLQLFTGSARRGHARTVVALSWAGREPKVVPFAGWEPSGIFLVFLLWDFGHGVIWAHWLCSCFNL